MMYLEDGQVVIEGWAVETAGDRYPEVFESQKAAETLANHLRKLVEELGHTPETFTLTCIREALPLEQVLANLLEYVSPDDFPEEFK